MLKNKIVNKIKKTLLQIKSVLEKETTETHGMLVIYARYLKGISTKEEMQTANKQFRDLLKGLGFGVFAALPFAFITLPLLVKLGKHLGIDLLPKWFKDDL